MLQPVKGTQENHGIEQGKAAAKENAPLAEGRHGSFAALQASAVHAAKLAGTGQAPSACSGQHPAFRVLAVGFDLDAVHVIIKDMGAVRFKVLPQGAEQPHKACLIVEYKLDRAFHNAADAGYGQHAVFPGYMAAVPQDISAESHLVHHLYIPGACRFRHSHPLKLGLEIRVNDHLCRVQHEIISIAPCSAVFHDHPSVIFCQSFKDHFIPPSFCYTAAAGCNQPDRLSLVSF